MDTGRLEVANGLNPFYNDAGEPSTNPFAHGLTNLQVYQNQSVLLADNYSTVAMAFRIGGSHARVVPDRPTVAFSDPDKDGTRTCRNIEMAQTR